MDWHLVENVADIPSPALLVYPDRVDRNIRRMTEIARGVERLRPHLKTNKLREVVRMHLDQAITKFKCATIAEAEMAAVFGAPDELLAYQPVGPNVKRFVHLVETFSGPLFDGLAGENVRISSKCSKTLPLTYILAASCLTRGRHGGLGRSPSSRWLWLPPR